MIFKVKADDLRNFASSRKLVCFSFLHYILEVLCKLGGLIIAE